MIFQDFDRITAKQTFLDLSETLLYTYDTFWMTFFLKSKKDKKHSFTKELNKNVFGTFLCFLSGLIHTYNICLWILSNVYECFWMFTNASECLRMLVNVHECFECWAMSTENESCEPLHKVFLKFESIIDSIGFYSARSDLISISQY